MTHSTQIWPWLVISDINALRINLYVRGTLYIYSKHKTNVDKEHVVKNEDDMEQTAMIDQKRTNRQA